MNGGLANAKESFLDLYLRYTQKQESPQIFHLWVGISVLAAAMGRKCYIERGYYRLYPNIFCILVAGSARCRKSTAINIGVRLLDGIPTTKVIGGKITPEKFVKEIAEATTEVEQNGKKEFKTPSILVHSSELAVFLTKQSYGEPLIHILTDLFDCPDLWEYKSKNKGIDILRNVFLCILAATTPDGVAKGIPQSAMQEGFASRVLFPFKADTDRRNAFPVLTAEELEMHLHLKDLLLARSTLAGPFTLTPEGHEWFSEWYEAHMSEPPPDRRLEGMFGRKHDHLLRVAMILAADRLEREIDPGFLEAALISLNDLEASSPGAFAQMGATDVTTQMDRCRGYLKRYKMLTHSQLLRWMQPCDSLTFRNVIDTLTQSGEIQYGTEKNRSMILWKED